MARPKADREIDGRLLTVNLPRPFIGIRMGEVRREAEHRRDLPRFVHHANDRIDVFRRQAAEEAIVVFDAFAAERSRRADPLLERHAAVGQVIEIALREDADARRHHTVRLKFRNGVLRMSSAICFNTG